MTLNDPIFGELVYDYSWSKNMTILFYGKETEIALMIDGEEDGKFDEEQYEAYHALIQKWENIQSSILQPILDYYHQVRHELGYDVEINEKYPLIETEEQILEHITLVGILIPYGDITDGRETGIIFDCSWDMENGLGLRLINEEIIEVGYQDVAI